MKRILYVRLPCEKIYPVGMISVADYVHKHSPGAKQHIIELSLIEVAKRKAFLADTIESFKPDIIAFSWRNIQAFATHDATVDSTGVGAMEATFKFDYSKLIGDKIQSVSTALRLIYNFIRDLREYKSYIFLARKIKPGALIVVGGTAFSVFAEQIIRQLPKGTIGIDGEGERGMLKIVSDEPLDNENVVYMKDGKLVRHHSPDFIKLDDFTPTDFAYIAGIFPQFHQMLDGEVGVNTKRGCPYKCAFCLYKEIEGYEERYRPASAVAEDVRVLSKEYGVKKIWFTDAQFILSERSLPVVEETLDRLIRERLDITWTGYLRVENIYESLAKKMIDSGISSFDFSFTGSQKIIDSLTLNYQFTRQMEFFKALKSAGFKDQKLKLYMPLNAPGETPETLMETIEACKTLYKMFGRERVYPWIFFLAIQPGTLLEKQLIESGYLKAGYNPLSFNPLTIKKLLYNPPPLGEVIGGCYFEATARAKDTEEIGRVAMELLEGRLVA